MTQSIVIVRGFKGEPRKLVALDWNDVRVQVGNPNSVSSAESVDNHTLSLPRADVFAFDPDALAALEREFSERGETNRASWGRLKPWASNA